MVGCFAEKPPNFDFGDLGVDRGERIRSEPGQELDPSLLVVGVVVTVVAVVGGGGDAETAGES